MSHEEQPVSVMFQGQEHIFMPGYPKDLPTMLQETINKYRLVDRSYPVEDNTVRSAIARKQARRLKHIKSMLEKWTSVEQKELHQPLLVA